MSFLRVCVTDQFNQESATSIDVIAFQGYTIAVACLPEVCCLRWFVRV